jgi:hypothetical protein
MSSIVKKRKHSNSPTRKKVRTESGPTEAPAVGTTTETESTHEVPAPRPLVSTSVGMETAPATPATVARPKNPHAGKVKQLRGNFGTGYHDTAHFKATDEKANHGVWQAKLPQVKKWVRMALDSIYEDDQFVVASKPGTGGTYRYLVSMDGATVGYLSGASVGSGEKPPAKHIEVYLDSKGNTVSAFPSSPEIF